MSRSNHRLRFGHQRPAHLRFLEKKGARRAVHRAIGDELRATRIPDDLLEVLADHHEERGHLQLAELLRRGRNPL